MLVGEQPGDYEDVAGSHSLVRLVKSWIGRLEDAESIGRRFTSRTRLNISMGAARQTPDHQNKLARDRSVPAVVGSGAANR